MNRFHALKVVDTWSVAVPPALGSNFRPDPAATGNASTTGGYAPPAPSMPLPPKMRMPRFDLAAMGGLTGSDEPRAFSAPPVCEHWMAAPEAQPAERMVGFAFAALQTLAAPMRMPQFAIEAIGEEALNADAVAPPASERWIAPPGAQPAERIVEFASAASLALPAPARSPRFGIAAVVGVAEIEMASPMRSHGAQAAERLVEFASAAELTLPAPVRLPGFQFETIRGDADVRDAAPPMRSAEPQPAERMVEFALTAALAPGIAQRRPEIGAVRVTGTFVRKIATLARSLKAEPAALAVRPVLDGRPASYNLGPAHLRFSLHAVEEIGRRPAPAQSPAVAGPRPGLPALPAESMPVVAAVERAALAPAASFRIPEIGCMTAQVLPQARGVAGPAALAVECAPFAGKREPVSLELRPSLRYPTLARFEPVDDAPDTLAAPVAGPAPAAAESIPSFAAFAVLPLPLPAALAAQPFRAELRARFGFPVVETPAPAAAAPPKPEPQPALLDPLARIAAQPAGAQPERPAPAIPQPGPFVLECYPQPIVSAAASRVEPIRPQLAVVLQPFAVPAAFGRIGDVLKKRPSRIVLPFEEIFAKAKSQASAAGRPRVNISAAGKIAAAVMVGLALWTGSRIANLSQHTEALKAQVAASERTVTVAESHAKDPTQANFGTGPVGKLRHAIANRAATEITDTFRSGMAAWGAEAKSLAPGWARHPQGYISTGALALFQPSLQYTDYRMEFYGQIESKSMGWVVRAQDKKNYYAMKVVVIEPGLRPIIAMAHYAVVNGKPGHRVQTPLNVMVHNNQPYHVAVDVRGNRFTASIEGEQVESWTDDTLASGGVGFFSDAGEKARLYWMKLSRNQDWVGRFCAYLNGDTPSRQQTAEVWGPGFPRDIPQPVPPRMPERALAARETPGGSGRPDRPNTAKHRRSEVWIS